MHGYSHDERVEATRLIIALLDNWGVSDSDQINLLGLPAGTRSRSIRGYRRDTPLPESPDVYERVEHLAGIAEALRTSHPMNPAAGAVWMRQTNHRFGNRAPIEAMLEDGLAGIRAVRIHLDCAYDWDVNGD